MRAPVTGLHHVTAVTADPCANAGFYAGVLGLRLVKRTVNFDDPSAYHLYYGDAAGSPGSLVTFFHWRDAARGRRGAGQVSGWSFSAPPASLPFWFARLAAAERPVTRVAVLAEHGLRTSDPDGIPVTILGIAGDPRPGWSGPGIPHGAGLRGLHTVDLSVRAAGPSLGLLHDVFGWRAVAEEPGRTRWAPVTHGFSGAIDLVEDPFGPAGRGGTGTVHHVAVAVPDDPAQRAFRQELQSAGVAVSPVVDRTYFHSIHFAEPGGALLEAATAGPGFTVDEPADRLGESLRLPPRFEPFRQTIAAALPPLGI